MPIAVTCPQCSRRHQAPDSLAGRQAKCGCGTVISVPAPAATAGAVPAAAARPSPKPSAAVKPRPAAARPTGAWQPVAAPQPEPAAPLGPSVFDDISESDLSRGKKPAAAAAVADSPVFTPSGSITSEIFVRARNELAEQEKTQAEKLPHSVSLAMAGLGVPGVLSLALGFWFLLALGSNFAEDFGSEFMIFMFIVCTLFAALDITTAVLLYMRVPLARPLAYFAAAVTLLTGCGNPANFICAIIALWFLSTPETGGYLSQKGKPGVIEW